MPDACRHMVHGTPLLSKLRGRKTRYPIGIVIVFFLHVFSSVYIVIFKIRSMAAAVGEGRGWWRPGGACTSPFFVGTGMLIGHCKNKIGLSDTCVMNEKKENGRGTQLSRNVALLINYFNNPGQEQNVIETNTFRSH